MLTITQFNILIRNFVCLLTLICLVLIVMLEFKNLYRVPSLLVLQENYKGEMDRIVKTKDSLSDFETIFEALDIQNFQATKTQLLVASGQKDQETRLELVNIKTKEVRKINYAGKFVSELVAGGDKFVMLVEDMNGQFRSYKSKMAMIIDDNPVVVDLNPQFLASAAYSIFINPNGSLLLFSGVANKQYVVDLSNLDSVTNLNMDTKLTLGFINDKQLAFANYLATDGVQVEILDLLTDQTTSNFLGNGQYNQIVVATDGQSISYTQSKEVNGTRVSGLKTPTNKAVYFMPNFSFENIGLNQTSDFLLFEKTKIDDLLSSNKRFEYTPNKSFAIYHLKTNYLSTGVIEGTRAIWAR